jgi:alkylation response protein AidB-like acyl-CoA dehydrogenase
LSVLAWALLGFGNVYYGLAQRALDLTLESVKTKKSIALSRSMAYHAHVQYEIAEMVMDLESIGPQLEQTARDWSNGVDYGANWVIKIVGSKYKAVEAAWRVVDTALDLAGGFGIFRGNEIERLFRDARLGRLHPANAALSHGSSQRQPSVSTPMSSHVGGDRGNRHARTGAGEQYIPM